MNSDKILINKTATALIAIIPHIPYDTRKGIAINYDFSASTSIISYSMYAGSFSRDVLNSLALASIKYHIKYSISILLSTLVIKIFI